MAIAHEAAQLAARYTTALRRLGARAHADRTLGDVWDASNRNEMKSYCCL
jgi:hypothetical protein